MRTPPEIRLKHRSIPAMDLFRAPLLTRIITEFATILNPGEILAEAETLLTKTRMASVITRVPKLAGAGVREITADTRKGAGIAGIVVVAMGIAEETSPIDWFLCCQFLQWIMEDKLD